MSQCSFTGPNRPPVVVQWLRYPTVNLRVPSSALPGDKHFICVIRHPVGNLKNFEYFLIYSNRASQRVSSST